MLVVQFREIAQLHSGWFRSLRRVAEDKFVSKIFSLYVIQCIWSLVTQYFFKIIINKYWLMTKLSFCGNAFGWVKIKWFYISGKFNHELWRIFKDIMWLASHRVAMTTILIRWYIMIVHPSIHSKLCDSRVWVKRIQV